MPVPIGPIGPIGRTGPAARRAVPALLLILAGCTPYWWLPSWIDVIPPPGFTLGRADTMEKVFRDKPWKGDRAGWLHIEAARGEVEGVQLIVIPKRKDGLRSVTVEVSDLKSGDGAVLPASCITWSVVGYVQLGKAMLSDETGRWWPDPLLPPQPFDVKAGEVQPIWLSVRVPEGARAGLYSGRVMVRTAGSGWGGVGANLEVHVWDFAIPKQQHLETCFLLRPDNLTRFYKLPRVPIELYERWIDFCVDHRISLTLNDWPQWDKDMERLVERQLSRGGACFCLSGAWFQKGKPEDRQKHVANQVAQIRKLYDRAKARGWLPRAYVYCHDEIGKEQYEFARELYSALKKSMPDLRLEQTFYKDSPIPALDDCLDIWSPVTGRYRAAEFQAQQAKGDEVWWYVCCGPGRPYANLMIEWPALDHRILLWQNWKFGVTGFLYWGTTVWRDNLEGDKRWPDVPWNPATWVNAQGKPHYGDGQLLYPGPDGQPLSSIRFENLRDGIEDYEYFWLLRDAVSKLKEAGGHEALVAEAEKALAIDDAVVKDLTHFTADPRLLREARAQIAALIGRARAALEK